MIILSHSFPVCGVHSPEHDLSTVRGPCCSITAPSTCQAHKATHLKQHLGFKGSPGVGSSKHRSMGPSFCAEPFEGSVTTNSQSKHHQNPKGKGPKGTRTSVARHVVVQGARTNRGRPNPPLEPKMQPTSLQKQKTRHQRLQVLMPSFF